MRKAVFIFVLVVLATSSMSPPVAAEEPAPRALEIAERLLDALGGREALDRTRFVRFNFFGARTHHWDRYTGRHRLEGTGRDGIAYLVLHNVNTREGEVWLDGARVEGEVAAERLEQAYEAWINDTYWLLMPYKLLDPGVHLAYDGEETLDGKTYDKVKLTFGDVGLTPGDTYWAYVDRASGLMDRWAYHLEDWEAERPAQHWLWLDWQRHGGILLSSRRLQPDGDKREAELKNIAVFDQLPDSVFTSRVAVGE